MITRSYSFYNQMQMSAGASCGKSVEDALLSCFPTAVKVDRATVSDDKQGTDYWITMQSGNKVSVDVKVREKDWLLTHPKEDDLALETWSVVGKRVGWTRDRAKRTDYIFWLWKDTGRWCLLPFPMLCSVFWERWETWTKTYKTKQQHTSGWNGGYYSECVFVPRLVIWRSIYEAFGGIPHRHVNTNVSLEAGIVRAQQVKCYTPRVEQ